MGLFNDPVVESHTSCCTCKATTASLWYPGTPYVFLPYHETLFLSSCALVAPSAAAPFTYVALKQEKNVVLLLYSKDCELCFAASHDGWRCLDFRF